MRERKRWHDDERAFERITTAERERLAKREPPQGSPWDGAAGLWEQLPMVTPSTRRRLLFHMLRLCRQYQLPPSALLVAEVGKELKISDRPLARVNVDHMRKAARYLVRHAGAGARAIGKAIGTAPTTVQQYFVDRLDFWAICAEEMQAHDLDRAVELHRDYVKKFGPTRLRKKCLCRHR